MLLILTSTLSLPVISDALASGCKLPDPLLITCPVMSAMVKNNDLAPDCNGRVSKSQVRDAMLRIGISGKVVKASANANFDHLEGSDDEKFIDLWAMNTITTAVGGNANGVGGNEHFRDTGIRDTSTGPNESNWRIFETFKRNATDDFTQFEISRATAAFDVDYPHLNVYKQAIHSNDVNEDNLARTSGNCGAMDSLYRVDIRHGTPLNDDPCFSNLHGSITFMFQEFGTPTGVYAHLGAAELRELFVHSEYPSGFISRSPRHCTGGKYGCDSCLEDLQLASPQQRASKQHRYCRCMSITDFTLSGGFNSSEPVSLPGVLVEESNEYATHCASETDFGGGPAAGSYGPTTVALSPPSHPPSAAPSVDPFVSPHLPRPPPSLPPQLSRSEPPASPYPTPPKPTQPPPPATPPPTSPPPPPPSPSSLSSWLSEYPIPEGTGPRPDQLRGYVWFDTKFGRSAWPLHRAAMRGEVNKIRDLCIRMSPNAKMTDWFDSQPIGWAASFGQLEAMIALIECGADTRNANKAGNTALADAQRERHGAVVTFLERYRRRHLQASPLGRWLSGYPIPEGTGPRPDQLRGYVWFDTKFGRSAWPLHRAAMRGEVNKIRDLCIRMSPNAKMTDWFDSQPIGWAASFGQLEAMIALIECGADTTTRNKANSDAKRDAQRERHQKVVVFLDAYRHQISLSS